MSEREWNSHTMVSKRGAKLQDPGTRYEYRIEVVEDNNRITYFSDGIDLSKPAFVSFAPRYFLSRGKGGEVKGQILTFPTHLVRKITNYMRT